MDLGTTPRSTATTAGVLSAIRAEVEGRQASQIREWEAIVAWASANIVTSPEGAATITDGYLDTGVPIAGASAPLVSEFALMELVAVLGRSPDGGRAYVGRIIECAWRLPQVYAAVVAGRLTPWRAEKIADLTHSLNADAAAFVDRQLFNASGVGWAQLDRLIAEAIVRHDPEKAETERQVASDQRYVEVGDPDTNGMVHLSGVMDAADGHDLDQAIARRASLLGDLGNEQSLDVRRSIALGEIARADLTLDLEGSPGRKAVLNVHITDTTLTGAGPFANPVGRWEEGRCPVASEQIRDWLKSASTIIVRPVIDLADHVPVDSYEIPDRHRARVILRDHTCRFPHCTRPAAKCDIDHARPHGEGGPTCPCNEVALCRRHHRAKTHSRWRYDITALATYEWTSPNGFRFRVDHRGTHPIRPSPSTDPCSTAPPERPRSEAP
ncbi:HNH endonuclease signature motif containing protein [Nocardioides humi]|uniref:HNH nuclease domain-containing protein n=1 Tax=Nocardioides humi TaxID=449461 RepID=A0ABN2ATH1_9ACTN|nr:HNH endonuclease signature motif containing protein [Nocardioides humi]